MIAGVEEKAVDAPMTVRSPHVAVTLREVRETAFRALVVAGASAGEAAVGAEQVLHAELHHGNGLRGLAQDLDAGPWPRRGLSSSPVQLDEWTVLRVADPERRGALRCASLVADLAAAAPPGTAILAEGLDELDALIDHALLTAATANGCVVAAVTDAGTGVPCVRVATPDAAIGWGDERILAGVTTPTSALQAGGMLLLRLEHVDRVSGTWLTGEELRQRRRAAAQNGLRVDTDWWARAYAASRSYLVPES